MEDQFVTIQVGVEELLFLLFTLGYRTLPGLGEHMTEGLNQDQIERAFAAGYNSLQARGWVQPSADTASKVDVDTTIAALLVTCATADRILLVNRQPVDESPEVCYVHFGPYLTVIHHRISAGVHRFIGVAGPANGLIAQELHLVQYSTSSLHTFEMPREKLDTLIATLKQGSLEDGIRMLTDSDLSEQEAIALAETIHTMRVNTMVAMLHLDIEHTQAPVDGFSLIESNTGLWMLQTTVREQNKQQLAITPLSTQDLLDKITSLAA